MSDNPTAAFTCSSSARDGTITVTVVGELDIATRPILDAELEHVAERAEPTVIVDLGAMSFMDSSGLAALLAWHKRFGESGTEFRLRAAQSAPRLVFELSGTSAVFQFEDW